MDDEEGKSENNANWAYDEISNAQERVLATQPRRSRQNHVLGAIKVHHRKVWEKQNNDDNKNNNENKDKNNKMINAKL